ncbi:ATP-binding protein [Chryseobacterium suipulveris]|uniref:ATP-binding protein n=1 Tax=Chryseobacterium suipulveris TaxID=2929800 RepID=A0ABY4BR08_9FLAO|nr:ATP-binding protein [Chryseobacterium suipulveris]UOE41622.1 ATP-binding protein [Chryseobacterium suipulveris]
MIARELSKNIKEDWDNKKAIVLLGPRQVGKTTLIQSLIQDKKALNLNGDDPQTRLQLSDASTNFLMNLVSDYDVLFIDEAQRIENIGLAVKILVDAKLDKQIIITGSSSLELGNEINEPLTGRKWEHHLFPLSWKEVRDEFTFAQAINRLEEFLIYGMYPEVVTSRQKEKVLLELSGSYLYKDILELTDIRKPDVLMKLLNALALQVGSEVSYNEIAKIIGIDRLTVVNYIDLLEKAFVVFRLYPFSTNQRNEITSKPKIYFYDNGIRNAIIGQFSPLISRNDEGELFENFFISEKYKRLNYNGFYGKMHYWRNTQQAEIDYLELNEGKINAYEIKYSPKRKVKFTKSFTEKYHPENTFVVNRDNFWEYL